jgi:hypothetical protein
LYVFCARKQKKWYSEEYSHFFVLNHWTVAVYNHLTTFGQTFIAAHPQVRARKILAAPQPPIFAVFLAIFAVFFCTGSLPLHRTAEGMAQMSSSLDEHLFAWSRFYFFTF